MKKILMALMLCLVSICGFAQLNIEGEYDGSQDKKQCLTVGYQWIGYNPSTGFSIISMTDNRFDKYGEFWLGSDKQSAILTINQLITLLSEKEKGYAVTVSDARGKKHTLSITKSFGVKSLWIKSDGCAGRYWISETQLQKCVDFINEQ